MAQDVAPIALERDGYVTLWSSDGLIEYPLVRTVHISGPEQEDMEIKFDCVDSYSLVGGPMEPFEVLSISIPKKKLISLSPDFENPDAIVPGKSKISVNYYGSCNDMVVTKCKVSGNSYNITAYHEAEIIKGLSTTGSIGETPVDDLIKLILGHLDTALGYTNHYNNTSETGFTKFVYDSEFWDQIRDDKEDLPKIKLPSNTNLWLALQSCALVLGCKVYFAGKYCYIVDYRQKFGKTSAEEGSEEPIFNDILSLSLYPTDTGATMRANVVSSPTYGQEGLDTVENIVGVKGIAITVSASGESGSITFSTALSRAPASIVEYGEREGQTFNVSFLPYYLCTVMGSSYLDYISEPQQSVTFTVKELGYSSEVGGGTVWSPFFQPRTRIGQILNDVDSITVDNTDCMGNVCPQKLFLSQYERSYPEGTSTYSFGVMGDINLAQSTSQIVSAIGGLANLK